MISWRPIKSCWDVLYKNCIMSTHLLPQECICLCVLCDVFDTSAVWSLVPAISAVWNPVAQFAHVNAEFCSSTLVLIGRTPWARTVWTWGDKYTNRSRKIVIFHSYKTNLCHLARFFSCFFKVWTLHILYIKTIIQACKGKKNLL